MENPTNDIWIEGRKCMVDVEQDVVHGILILIRCPQCNVEA